MFTITVTTTDPVKSDKAPAQVYTQTVATLNLDKLTALVNEPPPKRVRGPNKVKREHAPIAPRRAL